MKLMVSLFFILFLSRSIVTAEEIRWDFSDRSEFLSGDLIFNQSLAVLHPSLQVMNFKAGFAPLAVDVGDGEHGSFDETRYQEFSENGDVSGNMIRLNTDDFPILKVTQFILQQGWVLEPVGSKPLIIYSLSDVNIAGEIWCHGADGTDANNATAGTGGLGRCGGGKGGDGGDAGVDGSAGEDSDALVTGGRGGNTATPAVAGGGGGSWNTSSSAGNGANSSVAGGQAGDMSADPEFLTIAGGAGGGGGSGTPTEAGAGGGGGGGAVIIHAVRDFFLGTSPSSTFGFIRIHGGEGGSSNVQGGAGGGGGGGSVQVFVGRNIEIYNTDAGGASAAGGGAGGSNSLVAGGGNGGIGRSWFSSVGYNSVGTGFYTPAEQAPITPGNVEFDSDTESALSVTYDLQNTKATLVGLSLAPDSNDFGIEVAGSDDDFQSDNTGWQTDLSQVREKRYIRFRATISTSDVNDPDMLDSVTLSYLPGTLNEFEFTSTSCARIETKPPTKIFFLFMLLPFLFIGWLKTTTHKK